MGAVFTFARMTFLDAVRNRILWSILFFCLGLILVSFAFQELTISAFDRIVRDIGFAALNLFGVVISIFLGVSSTSKEIDRRTVYNFLSKPVSRGQYLLGKLLGMWAVISFCLALMLLAILIESAFYSGPVRPIMFEGFALILVEQLVLLSFALFVSSFAAPLVSAFVVGSFFIVGHAAKDIYFFVINSRSMPAWEKSVGKALYFALPNLDRLNLKTEVSRLEPVALSRVLSGAGQGFLYIVAFFLLSVAIFNRRDLK